MSEYAEHIVTFVEPPKPLPIQVVRAEREGDDGGHVR
jgi:hypothetical protein